MGAAAGGKPLQFAKKERSFYFSCSSFLHLIRFFISRIESMTAHYQVHGDIAVITLDNPPVNGLGLSTRQGIAQGMEQALADAAVIAIVVTGAGKAFSGGADIR